MKTMKWLKKLGAGLLSAALLGALTIPAFAATTPNPSKPDPNKTGAITLTKIAYQGVPSMAGTGLKLDDKDVAKLGAVVPGIKFNLYKVVNDSDVTATSKTTDFIADGGAVVDPSKVTLVEGTEKTTDANGQIKWGGAIGTTGGTLAQGYYILVEQQSLVGTTIPDYQRAPDTMITLPYGITTTGANDNNNWNFDIYVYPKNFRPDIVTKRTLAFDSDGNPTGNYVNGDAIEYMITANYDATELDGKTNRYIEITDYWPEVVDFTSATVTLTGAPNGMADKELTLATDYTRTGPTALAGTEATTYPESDGKYVFRFEEAIIAQMGAAGTVGKYSKIDIHFVGEVNPKVITATGTGSIKNSAVADYNGKEIIPDPPVDPTGGIIIDKVTNDSPEQKLAGAQFNIYESLDDIEYDANGTALGQGNPMRTKDGTNTILTATTNDQGYAKFEGIDIPATGDVTYYLFETNAPDGFIRLNKVFQVTLSRYDSTGTLNPDGKLHTVKITNQREGTDPPVDPSEVPDPEKNKPMFALPMTGGAGTVMFIVVGLGLMGGAIAIMIRNKNKNRA